MSWNKILIMQFRKFHDYQWMKLINIHFVHNLFKDFKLYMFFLIHDSLTGGHLVAGTKTMDSVFPHCIYVCVFIFFLHVIYTVQRWD